MISKRKASPKKIKRRRFRSWFLVILLVSAVMIITTGCRPKETSTPTVVAQTPTNTNIPPTATMPSPTETQMPTNPPTLIPTSLPTEEPAPPNLVGYLLNIPPPKSGNPSGTPTTVVSVRTGPGLNYPVYGLMLEEQTAKVIGVSSDGEWWAIRVLDVPLEMGWVFAEYINDSNTDGVPEIEPPPVPPTLVYAPPDISEVAYARFRETIYAYSGPGKEFPVYGVIPQGNNARTFYKTEDSEWWQIVIYSNLVPSKLAWVEKKYVEIRRAGAVPVSEIPPLPTISTLPTPEPNAPSAIPMAPIIIRSGPDIEYPALGVVPSGLRVAIIATNPNREWWQVKVPTEVSMDGMAWISAPFVYAVDTEGVPTIDPPPLPDELEIFEPAPGGPYIQPTDNIIAYAGPGTEWPALGMVKVNSKAVVVGVSPDKMWYVIRVPIAIQPNGQAWVSFDFVNPNLQKGVPIIEPPPK